MSYLPVYAGFRDTMGGVRWGGAVMTFLWTWSYVGDATLRIGVGWGGTVLHALAFYRKERMSRIGCEPKKNRRLEPGQRLAEGVTQKRNKRQMLY